MSEKFGDAFRDIPFHLRAPGSQLMKDFEIIKRDFGVSALPDDRYEVTLVMRGVEDSENYDSMTGKVMFDP
jgi:hypothetical protein